MVNNSTIGMVITVGGIAAIALTSPNEEARMVGIGAIAGLSTPLAQVIRHSPRRRVSVTSGLSPEQSRPNFSEAENGQ